jgi:hypothetical protein
MLDARANEIGGAKEDDMTDPSQRPIPPPSGFPRDDESAPDGDIEQDETVGGGIMQQGGTAIDRGTGTLGGKAQGPTEDDDRDDPLEPDIVDDDEVMPNPSMQD